MNFNALTLTLNNFINAFSGGYGRLSGAANGLPKAPGHTSLLPHCRGGAFWAL